MKTKTQAKVAKHPSNDTQLTLFAAFGFALIAVGMLTTVLALHLI